MSRFFSYFPQTTYSLNNGESYESVTNIFRRVKFDDKLKNNMVLYYTYDIEDGDRPEILAHKFYGDEEKHWIILLLNEIVDVNSQWPLTYSDFKNHIVNTYGSLNNAQTTAHSYFKTTTYQLIDADDLPRISKTQITLAEYNSLATGTETKTISGRTYTIKVEKSMRSVYDYENEMNEAKRRIKVLKPEYINNVMSDFQRLINE